MSTSHSRVGFRLGVGTTMLVAAGVGAALLMGGCERSSSEKIEDGARDIGSGISDAAKDAADATTDALKRADDKVGELVDD